MDIKAQQRETETFKRPLRRHAAFFEWHDKSSKELGVVLDFFLELEKEHDDYLIDIEAAEDPPDVRAIMHSGKLYAVEATELVNQKAIHHQINNNPLYKKELAVWNQKNTIRAIKNIITRKELLCRRIPRYYDKNILLIFTDEPQLGFERLKAYTMHYHWPRTRNLHEIYLLASCDQSGRALGLIKLR